ncbi:LysR substrate-binding domain-containing protein [Streptomyces sp. NPDC093094]|uniref:LysR substrate-binding domain-containing protein n=1 Tax=Streptomyces sp. NPDC093094 TaxID=3366026 RepID=UPI00381BDF3C
MRGEVGAVRIGFSGVAVLDGVLTRDLHSFHRSHPEVELTLLELPPAAQVQQVREGAIDVGYSPDLGLVGTDGLVLAPRSRTPLSIAMRHDHELAGAASVSEADLADRDLVVFAADENDGTILSELLTDRSAHRARIHLVSSTLGVLALAAAGVGVAVVPTATQRIALPEIVHRPLHGPDSGPRVVTISRSDELSGPVRAFLGRLAPA